MSSLLLKVFETLCNLIIHIPHFIIYTYPLFGIAKSSFWF